MRFTIVKNIGTNQPQQLSYDFIPPGGTMGRSPDNHWILPDKEQAIARLQAVVSISTDGECRITNRGAASEILLNTIPLIPDRQIEVRDGDILNVGDYQIQVMNIHQSASAPPLAKTRVLDTHILDTMPTSPGQPEEIPNTIWDGLENTFAGVDSSGNPQPLFQGLNDNNPLTNHQQNQERNPIDPLQNMEKTIDLDSLQFRATDPLTMFHTDTDPRQETIFNDTTPSTLLQKNHQDNDKNDKQEIDPLVLFSDKYVQRIKHDDPLDLILNNAEPLTTEKTTENFTEEKEENIFSAVVPDSYSVQQNVDPISYAPNHHQTNDIKLEGKLLTALLNGMGINHLQNPQFDEHALYKLGKQLSQLFQGIIALNASRSRVRPESGAEIAQVMANNNNPFKLLPSGQAVLIQMFGDHMPGFMSAEQATREILIELQAHQLGMITGLQAITTDILQRFAPSIIEQKAKKEDGFPHLSLSPTNKTYLWDYFIRHYQETLAELKPNMAMLGKNFWQAYQAEIIRYKESQDKSKNKK